MTTGMVAMIVMTTLAVTVGVVAMRLSWRLVNRISEERPQNEER
jgi:hypothetical protein